MDLPEQVRIVEVGPRDGLQNERLSISIEDKVRLIEDLAAAGIRAIECGSFVSPRRIPQMADTEAVFARLHRIPGLTYSALVPNLPGLERALSCGVEEIALFVAASESFSQANLQCSIEESFKRSQAVAERALACGMRVRAYVSCVLGCPFEGTVDPSKVTLVASRLAGIGCYEISLGDTIGVGTPRRVDQLLSAVSRELSLSQVAVHFHDTYGQALANVLASLQHGVCVIDSSVSGLGGCPYAPGATGNVATEDVVYMLEGMGISTGVDLERLASAGEWISARLGRKPGSKVAVALAARCNPQNREVLS